MHEVSISRDSPDDGTSTEATEEVSVEEADEEAVDEESEESEPAATSTITVDHPEEMTATYNSVTCQVVSDGEGTAHSVLATEEGVTDSVLTVVIQDGNLTQVGFNREDVAWSAFFGDQEPGQNPTHPVTVDDGTSVSLEVSDAKVLDPTAVDDGEVDEGLTVNISGTLTCTSGRLDDEQVGGGEEGDNTLAVSGAVDQELVLTEVLCQPSGDSLIVVGETDAGDQLTVSFTDGNPSALVALDGGSTYTTGSIGDEAPSEDELSQVDENAVSFDGLEMESSDDPDGDGITITGTVRCLSGATN